MSQGTIADAQQVLVRLQRAGLWAGQGEVALTGDASRFGGDRSRRDQSFIDSAVYVGATFDDIRAIYGSCPIGDKHREQRRSGDKYLWRSFEKAQAWPAR